MATPTSTYTIHLKFRPNNDVALLSRAEIVKALSNKDVKDSDLRAMLTRITDAMGPGFHDKHWLSMIVGGTFFGKDDRGVAVSELFSLAKLRKRVEALDDSKEGPFTISAAQAEIIKKRLKDPNFKLDNGFNPQFAAFLLDLAEDISWNMVENPEEWWEPETKIGTPVPEPAA